MEPLHNDADDGVEPNHPHGRDFPVNAVVVPLADVTPTELGQRKFPRIAHALSLDSAEDRERARPDRVWRWTVTVQGTCRRPSTTSADRRRDALFTATRFIETAKRIVRFEPTRLGATITHAPCDPVSADELPGQHVLCLELRDTDPATIGRIYERLAAEAWTIGRLSSSTFTFTPHASNPSVLYDATPVAAPAAAPSLGSIRSPELTAATRSSRAG
ncbi:MAG: hypothetical protein ACJ79K_14770 [Gemmatimonadaceae bacterium]